MYLEANFIADWLVNYAFLLPLGLLGLSIVASPLSRCLSLLLGDLSEAVFP